MTEFDNGFIMLCTSNTEKECLDRNLFGDRARRFQEICGIKPGDVGLLLNVSKDELIGIFKAQSDPQLHIEPNAWDGDFPAQVRVEPIGKLQRINDAAYILNKVGLPLTKLPSGVPVPQFPVCSSGIFNKLLAYFR